MSNIRVIKEVLSEWISQWQECTKCDNMVREELIAADNQDELVCIDCIVDKKEFGTS